MHSNNIYRVGVLVVTYNRYELLRKLISSLEKVNYPLNEVLIYDNCSDYPIQDLNFISDCNFLGNPAIKIFQSENNTGGSGGFSNGISMLYENNDFVWTMDDDITFEEDSLEILIKEIANFSVIVPAKIDKNKNIIDVASSEISLSKPFFLSHKRNIFCNTENASLIDTFKVETFSFEGALFRSSIFDEIGLPVSNFFICHDDLEFSFRMKQYNKDIGLTTHTLCTREFIINRYQTFIGWKSFYSIRNYFWVNKKYSKKRHWYFRPIFFSCLAIAYSIILLKVSNIPRIINGIRDGISND